MASPLGSRLILVSNRLPVTIKPNDGTFDLSLSSGGLVTGLSGLAKTTQFRWYGWPGLEVPGRETAPLTQKLQAEHDAVPVFIADQLAEKYYNGFSNTILWPLLHYQPVPFSFDESAWNAYKEVNRLFAKAIVKDVRDGDLVWVHDFHLMLLPAMLREELREVLPHATVTIGWFLHTSFPSPDVFRKLPVREELLFGVLQSDLLGFHTNEYAKQFLNNCSQLRGTEVTPTSIQIEGRQVEVGTFPIGIDPVIFSDGLKMPEVQDRIAALQKDFAGRKVIVGVDRLDYIKGIPHKLMALDSFFSEHPEWVNKLILVQVAVPTRSDVEEYQNLRTTVEEQVSRINGHFGSIEHVPIHYLHKSISFEELTALYYVSDVCFVTSTRDGMNLVAYEYIACQDERQGVLILSEFTGAAEGLNGSLFINPWNPDDMANAILQAVTMGEEKKKVNCKKLIDYVNIYTSARWGQTFVERMKALVQQKLSTKTNSSEAQ